MTNLELESAILSRLAVGELFDWELDDDFRGVVPWEQWMNVSGRLGGQTATRRALVVSFWSTRRKGEVVGLRDDED
jgi:hypothetical protein